MDLKRNANGVYLKISERQRSNRNTIMIPLSGLVDVVEALNDAIDVTEQLEGKPAPAAESTARPSV